MLKKLFLLCFLININLIYGVVIPDKPVVDSKAAIVMDFHSGEILVEKDIHEKLPMASVTKVMTAYVIFEEIERGAIALTDEVLISEKAWRMTGSRMFIEVNSQVSVDLLLRGLISQSGNDAAVALAEHSAKTVDDFADLMNKYAVEIGMDNTNFKNPHGLHNNDHYSTVYDFAILGKKIIEEHPEFYQDYFSIKEFTFNNILQKNRNQLIHQNPMYDGF
jgi:D-alanyl-D-alanine carboxypeptidase (penicillin-binding protein 5/6)